MNSLVEATEFPPRPLASARFRRALGYTLGHKQVSAGRDLTPVRRRVRPMEDSLRNRPAPARLDESLAIVASEGPLGVIHGLRPEPFPSGTVPAIGLSCGNFFPIPALIRGRQHRSPIAVRARDGPSGGIIGSCLSRLGDAMRQRRPNTGWSGWVTHRAAFHTAGWGLVGGWRSDGNTAQTRARRP